MPEVTAKAKLYHRMVLSTWLGPITIQFGPVGKAKRYGPAITIARKPNIFGLKSTAVKDKVLADFVQKIYNAISWPLTGISGKNRKIIE